MADHNSPLIYCPCCGGGIFHCGDEGSSPETNYMLLGPVEDGCGNPVPGGDYFTWEALCGGCDFSFVIKSDHRPERCPLAAKDPHAFTPAAQIP